ncbi:MAG: hypothetical protein RL380_1736 [Verrucomicrobiota bacterium]|jgi:predicted Zn-dependent protease
MKKFLIAVLLLALLFVGWFFGLPAYRAWKEKRFVTQAQAFLAQKDYTNAILAARQAIVLNANNAAAWAVRARTADAAQIPGALDLWQRVVNLAPTPTNHLALARACLLAQKVPRARDSLLTIPPEHQNNATYHELAGMVCAAEKNLPAADWHFGETAKFDPDNKSAQLNQAVIRLSAKKPEAVADAKKILTALIADPLYAKDALRHLTFAALRERDFARATQLATQLAALPAATLDDRLMKLAILQESAADNFRSELAQLKTAAAPDPEDTYALASWLATHGLAADALAWLGQLPADAQAKPAVRLARADVLQASKDWPALENFLADQNWGELEFIRLAQLAHATRAQNQTIAADAHWNAALRVAAERLKPLTVLHRLATAWGWDDQREEILNTLIERHPNERWAFGALNQFYNASGNTRGLQKVFARLVDLHPDDLGAKNNLAYFNTLLGIQPGQTLAMAREVYAAKPHNPACASTFALALHANGQTAEALTVMQRLPPADLESPDLALCYGVILAAGGDQTAAGKYLAVAAKEKLLAEETKLLKTARGEN